MKHTLVVRKPADLTVDWAQRIVNRHASDITVFNVAITSIDIGTTTRVRLCVDHNASSALPKQWFVKFPSLSYRAQLITALPRLLPTEVRFYHEIAPSVPVNKPFVLAGQSCFGRGATLVLSDVTEMGASPGSPDHALSFLQALQVTQKLAQFHAAFWHKVHQPHFQWLAASVRRLEDNLGAFLAVPLMKRGLRLAGDYVPASLHDAVMAYARHRKQAMTFLASGAPTLIHHDCHPGNLFWQETEPGFLDWQLVRIGEGVSDMAYFLATALEPDMRRNHEQIFLETYLTTLAEQGVGKLDKNQLMARYRAHIAYALEAMIVTLAVGGLMPLASNLELIRRAAQAAKDHDVFSELPIGKRAKAVKRFG